MASSKPVVFFPNLDGIRFVAFFGVFLSHSFVTRNAEINSQDWHSTLLKSMDFGIYGVVLFFVLSGFLITYLLLVEENSNGKIDVKNFYIRRVLRIWPLYYAVVLFGFVGFPLLKQMMGETPTESADPLLYITFLANYNDLLNGPPDSSILGVLWSVAIEEQFYLLWPLLMILFRKNRYILYIACIVTSLVYRVVELPIAHSLMSSTLANIGSLAFGGLMAQMLFAQNAKFDFIRNMEKWKLMLTYLSGFFVIYLCVFYTELIFIKLLGNFLLTLFFGFVILEQELAQHSFYKFSKLKRISFWGKYTYGLYSLHQIGILAALILGSRLSFIPATISTVIVEPIIALSIAFLISYISYEWYEKPFLKLKNRFSYVQKEAKANDTSSS